MFLKSPVAEMEEEEVDPTVAMKRSGKMAEVSANKLMINRSRLMHFSRFVAVVDYNWRARFY